MAVLMVTYFPESTMPPIFVMDAFRHPFPLPLTRSWMRTVASVCLDATVCHTVATWHYFNSQGHKRGEWVQRLDKDLFTHNLFSGIFRDFIFIGVAKHRVGTRSFVSLVWMTLDTSEKKSQNCSIHSNLGFKESQSFNFVSALCAWPFQQYKAHKETGSTELCPQSYLATLVQTLTMSQIILWSVDSITLASKEALSHFWPWWPFNANKSLEVAALICTC